jgi:chemotaxis protein methyltransferase CheR
MAASPLQKGGAAAMPSGVGAGFSELTRLLEESSGIALGDEKAYLAIARLEPLLKELKVSTLGALARLARAAPEPRLISRIVDALATHETSFFRDPDLFALIRSRLLPNLPSKRPRFWCAACSTGQEPYSLAMTILDAVDESKVLPQPEMIMATDLSDPVVLEAITGVYDMFAVSRGLTAEQRTRFFESKGANRWQVKTAVRELVRFKQANLLNDLTALGDFDLVLIRNVLMYFADATKTAVLQRLARRLRPGGYLILGGSELLAAPPEGFEPLSGIQKPIFRRQLRK